MNKLNPRCLYNMPKFRDQLRRSIIIFISLINKIQSTNSHNQRTSYELVFTYSNQSAYIDTLSDVVGKVKKIAR
jgi:hypothetical protein